MIFVIFIRSAANFFRLWKIQLQNLHKIHRLEIREGLILFSNDRTELWLKFNQWKTDDLEDFWLNFEKAVKFQENFVFDGTNKTDSNFDKKISSWVFWIRFNIHKINLENIRIWRRLRVFYPSGKWTRKGTKFELTQNSSKWTKMKREISLNHYQDKAKLGQLKSLHSVDLKSSHEN